VWLVLSDSSDPSAAWARHGLRLRGLDPIELVTADRLVSGALWSHRIDGDGARFEILLADGRRISSNRVRGALNRIVAVPPEALAGAAAEDRDYALQELTAFFMSWLHALPGPVLGRPTPQGLSGRWRHVSEWVWLAAAAGLRTPAYHQGSHNGAGWQEPALAPFGAPRRTVLVAGSRAVASDAPATVLEGCLRLSRLADAELLGVDFTWNRSDGWTFVGASPYPDLRPGGEQFLDALASILRGS
jgi:hypothetical protein